MLHTVQYKPMLTLLPAPPEEITYLHLQCLSRKVKSVTSNAQSSTELLYLDVPTGPILWVDATSMSATRKSAVKNSLGSCNRNNIIIIEVITGYASLIPVIRYHYFISQC